VKLIMLEWAASAIVVLGVFAFTTRYFSLAPAPTPKALKAGRCDVHFDGSFGALSSWRATPAINHRTRAAAEKYLIAFPALQLSGAPGMFS
jgi:hypothetical protein